MMATNITKASRPSTYKGQRDVRILNSWIFQMERYFRLCETPEEKKALYASTYLTHQANTWYEAWETSYLASVIGDQESVQWIDFVTALRDTFLPPNHHLKLRDQLAHIRQRSSVAAYNTDFMNIQLQLSQLGDELTSFDAIDRYLRGLKPNVEKEMRLRQDQLGDLGAIMKAADTYDSISFNRWFSNISVQGSRRNQAYNQSTPFSDNSDGPTPMELDTLSSNCHLLEDPIPTAYSSIL